MVVLGESPSKRDAGVPLFVNEQEHVSLECGRSKQSRDSGEAGGRVAASIIGMVTEIGPSEMDAMVLQGTSGRRVGALRLCDATSAFKLPPREELVSGKKFSERSNLYACQSAKTWLRDFFELISPTVWHSGHNTTSHSAHQMDQFALSVGFEVEFAYHELLEDLLVPSRGICAIGLRGGPGRSPCPSALCSILNDSVAWQSRHSLRTVTGVSLLLKVMLSPIYVCCLSLYQVVSMKTLLLMRPIVRLLNWRCLQTTRE